VNHPLATLAITQKNNCQFLKKNHSNFFLFLKEKKFTGTWGSKEVTGQVTLDCGQVTGDWTGTVVRSNKLTAACPLVCTGN
jgi:hypothetical protein